MSLAASPDQTSLSDEEEENEFEEKVPAPSPPTIQGTLNKWTNYIHGWQERFIVLKDASLSYYKSENETAFGCRGVISIRKAAVKIHEFDMCRFDVSVGDCVWYLRADSPETQKNWVDAIEAYKQYIDSAYGSENSLRRHGSVVSLSSISLSSVKKSRGLMEKVAEVETYRDILCRQIDSLQSHLDTFAASAAISEREIELHNEEELESGLRSDTPEDRNKNHDKSLASAQQIVDFKGEAITFKATTAGILATITHCIDLMQQREDSWRKKVEIETEKRKRVEELLKQGGTHESHMLMSAKTTLGPDYEEGPHTKIKEEEFFDALDAMLDKHDKQAEEKRILKIRAKEIGQPSSSLPGPVDHTLWPEIQKITMDQLYYARLEVGEGDAADPGGWNLFAEEGEMRLYRREVEIDGLVCDPLKAVHTVKGVTGHEMCYHFFSPDVRWDWENTLESMKVVEEVNPNTLVFHQIHKRVWPAAQRDAVFWSHIRKVQDIPNSDNLTDVWIVCNKSCDYHDIPLGRCVRMKMTVSLVCETSITQPRDGTPITRDDITCRIIYCSTINPGGWAPASVLRALYKREYPKFVKRFTQYVIDAQEKKEILF